jgi:pilus assembly protein Flp/PilA
MNQATALLGRAYRRGARTASALSQRLRKAARGQGLVEYSLILVLIAVVAIGAMTLFGGQVSSMYSEIDCGVTTARTGVKPAGCP